MGLRRVVHQEEEAAGGTASACARRWWRRWGGGGRPKAEEEEYTSRCCGVCNELESLWPHRLRGMPFLGRNMGLVSGMTYVIIGFTILVNYPYRNGIETVTMTVLGPDGTSQIPKPISIESQFGALLCVVRHRRFGGTGL